MWKLIPKTGQRRSALAKNTAVPMRGFSTKGYASQQRIPLYLAKNQIIILHPVSKAVGITD